MTVEVKEENVSMGANDNMSMDVVEENVSMGYEEEEKAVDEAPANADEEEVQQCQEIGSCPECQCEMRPNKGKGCWECTECDETLDIEKCLYCGTAISGTVPWVINPRGEGYYCSEYCDQRDEEEQDMAKELMREDEEKKDKEEPRWEAEEEHEQEETKAIEKGKSEKEKVKEVTKTLTKRERKLAKKEKLAQQVMKEMNEKKKEEGEIEQEDRGLWRKPFEGETEEAISGKEETYKKGKNEEATG